MPQSKHRRKGRQRPRAHQTAPPPKNPTPSASWVPALGVGLLVGGVAVVLGGYFFLQDVTWPIFGPNWGLVAGFTMLIAGFIVLTRWR